MILMGMTPEDWDTIWKLSNRIGMATHHATMVFTESGELVSPTAEARLRFIKETAQKILEISTKKLEE